MNNVKLNFWGYTWEQFREQIEDKKGILLVYKGIRDDEKFVAMKELVYISYSTINELYESSIINSIKVKLAPEEMLFFSLAEVDPAIAEKVSKLLNGTVMPTTHKENNLPLLDFVIECSGKCDFLPRYIKNNHISR